MTDLLVRLFVKAPGDYTSPRVRGAVGTLSGAVGIGCNVLLCLCKLLIGAITGAVSITADGLNNLSDASGSIVTVLGFRLADKPADEKHPYGHARAEYLSGLAVAVLILFIGYELVKTSVRKILAPSAVEFSALTVWVLLGSMAVKLWMYRFNRTLGRRIGSTALLAAAADSRNDCVATGAVLAAALTEHFFRLPVDGWMGLGVAVFILCSGMTLARDTVSPLLGETAGPELREQILDYIRSRPEVLGLHDLMVHDYGAGSRYASVHVEMDYRRDPLECHDLIDAMERECLRSHGVHLVIHYDPVITDDPELTALRDQCAALLAGEDSALRLHDFRMVPGKQHRNLCFDVPLPSALRGREEEIRLGVERGMNGPGERKFHIRITFDQMQG